MGNTIKKYTVRLNNYDKVEQLLQENYDQACQQYKTLQDEMNKVANTTVLKDLDIDGKEKYGKIMANYISLQQKSVTQKFDIAKLMAEIAKCNGNVKEAIDASKSMPTTLDLNKLRQLATEAQSSNDTEKYSIHK